MAQQYTSDTIGEYANLQHIRKRPKMYIISGDDAGIVHTIWEYLANSLDEVTMVPEGKTEPVGGTIHIGMFRDRVHHKFQILVKDTGRGIPSDKLRSVVTKLGTSGKISSKTAYRASGGQLGYGAKVAAALSTKYRIFTKNYLETVVASLRLADGNITGEDKVPLNLPSGVLAIFELDTAQFFLDGADFMESGYIDLVNLCKQLNIFNESIDFQFYIYDRKLPETVWSAPIPDAIGTLNSLLASKNKEVAYDSLQVIDKPAYLFEIWRTNSEVIFSDVFKKISLVKDDRLSFEVKYYVTKRSGTGLPQYFVAVNNVSLVDRTGNDATITFMRVLREQLSKLQETPEYQNFVLNDYNFPTSLIAIDIHYDGAELSGTTKNTYRDATFSRQFASELAGMFSLKGDAYWQDLALKLSDDIKLRYAQFYDMPLKKSEGRRVFVDLKYSKNYKECKSSDNTKCELYIVEGTSAGNITKTRDNEFQAIYETKGKPINPTTYLDRISENRKELMSDDIYKDLSKILNISPHTTDMSTARFSKIIIATDADPDGYHIAALHINNLYILNPRIIESGMVWVARPPLYSMELGRKRFLFLRDKVALYDARVKYIYRPALDIEVESPAGTVKADDELFREIVYLVKHIGERFYSVAQSLNVPILIVERLVLGIEYLYPTINFDQLVKCFASHDAQGYVRVAIDYEQSALIVSVGSNDYLIGLERIGRTIVQQLLPLVKKYRYNDITYRVTTKMPGSALKRQPMTPMMLYVCLKNLDEKLPLPIHRYKGLGEMPSASCFATLMNPQTRAITQITSIGDLKESYELLGTDTAGRKRLLAGSVALSNTFAREQIDY